MDCLRLLRLISFYTFFLAMFISCVVQNGPQGSGQGAGGTINPSTALDITPAAFDEDVESIITLSYSDPDNGLASSCSLSSLSGVTATTACSCSAGVCTVGVTGTSNYNGAASFRYQVVVNGVTSSRGLASLTINPINDAPTVATIAAQSMDKNTVKTVSFSIADVDSTVTCASSVSATSSNTALIPVASIVVTGTALSCTATITSSYNSSGTSTIGFTVTDGTLTGSGSFTMTVVNVNYAPTISTISNASTAEDTAVAVNFTIDDIDSSPTMACSSANLAVYSSSNGTLIPGISGSDVVFSGAYPNCTATFTPALNQTGTSNIVIRVTDNGSAVPATQTVDSNAFTITVTPVDDAPTITPSGLLPIGNQTIDEDSSTSALTFTVADVDSTVACSSVVGSSSDQAKILDASIVVAGGAGTSCTVTITPVANVNGTGTVITLTLGSTTSTFTVDITPVPDISGSLTVASNMSGVASAYSTTYSTRKLDFNNTITVDEAVSNVEVCFGTTAGGCEKVGWTSLTVGGGTNQYTTSGAAPTVAIAGNYRFSTSSSAFTLTHSCSAVAATNYYFSVRVTNSSGTKASIDSEGWSFWQPTCLAPNLMQWLDAKETSTITIGTGVSAWNDKSASGGHITQATPAYQPTYSATELGGTLPGVTFDGVSTFLGRNSYIYAQGSANLFAVISASATGAENYIFTEGRATGTNFYAPLMNSASDTITGRIENNTGPVLSAPASDTPAYNGSVNLIMAKDSGSSFTTYSNGTVQTQASTAYTRGTNTISTYSLGAKYMGGVYSDYFSGTLSELIIVKGTLSTADREKIEGYSAHKWEVSGNLPVAHTYKASPPSY